VSWLTQRVRMKTKESPKGVLGAFDQVTMGGRRSGFVLNTLWCLGEELRALAEPGSAGTRVVDLVPAPLKGIEQDQPGEAREKGRLDLFVLFVVFVVNDFGTNPALF